jgi:hypothetical protein
MNTGYKYLNSLKRNKSNLAVVENDKIVNVKHTH